VVRRTVVDYSSSKSGIVGESRPVDPGHAEKLFERIRAAHPGLHMILDRQPKQVDLEMTIPVQAGLSFGVRLNLQGDELHLEAGDDFRLEYHRGHQPEIADRYFDAVDGLLAGRYRIVEYHRSGRAVRAQLQAPVDGRWEVLGTCSRLHVPIPWRTTQRILLNAPRG
jgi:hypothetical protein